MALYKCCIIIIIIIIKQAGYAIMTYDMNLIKWSLIGALLCLVERVKPAFKHFTIQITQ